MSRSIRRTFAWSHREEGRVGRGAFPDGVLDRLEYPRMLVRRLRSSWDALDTKSLLTCERARSSVTSRSVKRGRPLYPPVPDPVPEEPDDPVPWRVGRGVPGRCELLSPSVDEAHSGFRNLRRTPAFPHWFRPCRGSFRSRFTVRTSCRGDNDHAVGEVGEERLQPRLSPSSWRSCREAGTPCRLSRPPCPPSSSPVWTRSGGRSRRHLPCCGLHLLQGPVTCVHQAVPRG